MRFWIEGRLVPERAPGRPLRCGKDADVLYDGGLRGELQDLLAACEAKASRRGSWVCVPSLTAWPCAPRVRGRDRGGEAQGANLCCASSALSVCAEGEGEEIRGVECRVSSDVITLYVLRARC